MITQSSKTSLFLARWFIRLVAVSMLYYGYLTIGVPLIEFKRNLDEIEQQAQPVIKVIDTVTSLKEKIPFIGGDKNK